MKKNYQKPNTDIVKVEIQHVMVQASLDNGKSIDNSSDFGSRRYNYDDEYEDEWEE